MPIRSSWVSTRNPSGGYYPCPPGMEADAQGNCVLAGQGGDWWSQPEGMSRGPENQYEGLLNTLRGRFIQDPIQKAQGAAAGAVGGMGYGNWLNDLWGAAGAPTTGSGGFNRFEREDALKRMVGSGSPLLSMLHQIKMAKADAFGQAYGQSIGPTTSLVQGSGGQLQGYRGQDMNKYLTEKGWEHQMKMMMAQLKGMKGGKDFWDVLFGLGQTAGNVLPWIV